MGDFEYNLKGQVTNTFDDKRRSFTSLGIMTHDASDLSNFVSKVCNVCHTAFAIACTAQA